MADGKNTGSARDALKELNEGLMTGFGGPISDDIRKGYEALVATNLMVGIEDVVVALKGAGIDIDDPANLAIKQAVEGLTLQVGVVTILLRHPDAMGMIAALYVGNAAMDQVGLNEAQVTALERKFPIE